MQNTEELNFTKLYLMISELSHEIKNSYKVFSDSYKDILEGDKNFNAEIAVLQICLMEDNKKKLSNAFNQEVERINSVNSNRKSRIEKLKLSLKNFVDISDSLKKNKNIYLENKLMAESEIYMYKINITKISNKINHLENECQLFDQKITEVKTENKALYSKEYDLIHKILHYEKKLSEYTNLKQKNLIQLSSAKNEFNCMEIKLGKLKCVKEKIISTLMNKKSSLEQKIKSLEYKISEMKIYISYGSIPSISYNQLLPLLNYKIDFMKNIVKTIQNEKKTQSLYYEEKKFTFFNKIREMIQNTSENINECEFYKPEELINKLNGLISPLISKNNYYEFIEKEANINELKEMKYKMKTFENNLIIKLTQKKKQKIIKLLFITIKDDFVKNKKTKQVKFNIKPEIINSDYYQSTENNKKSNKKRKNEITEKKFENEEYKGIRNFNHDPIEDRDEFFKQISRNIEFTNTAFTTDKKKKRYYSNFII